MNTLNELIEESILTAPLALLNIKDSNTLDLINNYLPYSIGFEIECLKGPNFNEANYKSIPDLIHLECDSSEQRFRIPNGLKGLICLYNICEQLKVNSILNPDSGIHYHIDMTDCFKSITPHFVGKHSNFILTELDTWNYQGTYNKRECKIDERCWVQFQRTFKTCEIRIGEMTFDYELLVKRMIHASKIVKKLKEDLRAPKVNFTDVDKEVIINYLQNSGVNSHSNKLIDSLNEEIKNLQNPKAVIQDLKAIIKKRTIYI